MFRERIYSKQQSMKVINRLIDLKALGIKFNKIKYFDMKHNNWLDDTEIVAADDYKIHKEVLSDDLFIFYVYEGELT